ncbi:MAG: hypothetical protein ACR2L6_01385 [Gemmatimonadaceae bacterium]
MTRRSKIWLVGAVLFTLANFGAGVFVLVEGEPVHAGGHAALLLLGAYLVRRAWRKGESDTPCPGRRLHRPVDEHRAVR